ncbi:hypothetical protein ACH46N_23460 [Streptomyces pristinaespiralis]|uniref:Membrane protein n=1 Tax=Streptomyces pristinaespiralis TaxID=38300 RepID=A0A0M4DH07_STRPR|nr:hypothetical protein [Streptomyces pristinaespiralis]ALC22322.1 membrane protein [Streptomyces pristinaespiralis]QMU15057.1 hypothetical protein H3L99_16810 [Streptomyces pristinaespiralis]
MSSDQQYPYGQQPYPPYEDPYRQQRAGYDDSYPQQQQSAGHEQQYGQQPYRDAGETQTWQGETWDTQYQPAVQPGAYPPAGAEGSWAQQPQPQPQHQQQPQSHSPVPAPGAAETAYLPPVPAAAGLPLPPEAPVPHAPAHASGEYAAAPAPVAEPAPEARAGYSSPTVGGNARITDAQRARAEGRSPIIAPGMQPAGLTAVLALLLAGGAAVGPYALLVPLVLLQAVTAAGWFRLNGMWPARQGIALAFLGGLAADAALLASGEGNAPAAIIGTLGVWVLLTLVLQLRSRAGSDERMYGLMATVASAAFAVLAAGHLAAADDAVVVGAIAVAVATTARALPLGGVVSVVLSLAAAAGAGIAAGEFTGMGSGGALLGLAAGGCALIGLRVASYDYPSRFVHMTAGVALPLTAAAPAVYLIGRALA